MGAVWGCVKGPIQPNLQAHLPQGIQEAPETYQQQGIKADSR